MVMQDQAKRLSEPLRWTRTSRLAVISACVVLVAAFATVAVVVQTSKGPGPGCIDVAFPSTLGVAEIHPCGAKARTLCANPAENPAVAVHGVLREACVRAGLPYAQAGGAG